MIMRWRQVLQEDRKWKDILICYSCNEKSNMMTHEEALTEAKKRLNNENTVRIIIERGEF